MRDARKLFRLGKSLNEFNFIVNKITNEMAFKSTPEQYIEITSKLCFFLYWLFDSSSILSKLKILSFDVKQHTKYACTAWFLGTFISLIKLLLDLSKLINEKNKEGSLTVNPVLDKKIFNLYLNIIGKIGDLLPSAQGAEIPQRLIGKGFNETLVGYGGLISALVAVRNTIK